MKGIGFKRRAVPGGPQYEGCYLLRDDFPGVAAPLASPRICVRGPGSLTLDQTDGNFSIVDGEFTWPAQVTPTWGDQDWYALGGDADGFDVLGNEALALKFRGAWLTDDGVRSCWFGFNLDVTPDTVANAEHTFYRAVALGSGIRCTSGVADAALALRDLWSPNLGDYFQTAIVIRAYLVGGGHWYPGASGAYAWGAHFFWRDEAGDDSWRLAWYRQLQSRTDPLYPAFSNYDTEGKFDFVRIPCRTPDLSDPLLTPIAYDEFTDNNGVTLPNHTMTYGGLTWVNEVGVWTINGNEAVPDNNALATADVPTLVPDVWVEADVDLSAGGVQVGGLIARRSADTAGGANMWYVHIRDGTAGVDTYLVESIDGAITTRASSDQDWTAAAHNLRVRCDDEQITIYGDYVEVAHFATAWFNKHATWHGLFAYSSDDIRFDNFIVLPRGTGLTRIAYDAFTDINGTSLDAHAMDEGGLAWVERNKDWDIQGNEARCIAGVWGQAYVESGVSDCWVTARVLLAGNNSRQGILIRASAPTGANRNQWEIYHEAGVAGVDTKLTQRINAVATDRILADMDPAIGRHYLSARCLAQSIAIYLDGALVGTYNSATFNETATEHGLWENTADANARWDQFRITEIPALGEYDAALDSF